MNVLVILGHPRTDSFCSALASAYCEGAKSAGMNVILLRLAELSFNPNVTSAFIRNQSVESDIEMAKNHISWAHHVVFVYPTWWSTMPGLMKGFLDRVLIPGFAFEEWAQEDGWTKLLTGKSAQLITTMDTPRWVYRWIYGAPGDNAMKKGTLGYCGFKPVRSLILSPVKHVTHERRLMWLEKVKTEGFKLKDGLYTPWQNSMRGIGAWLRAIRLQFYPMTWVAYAVGAYGIKLDNADVDRSVFWTGYAFLFFLEMATVLSNDYYDYRTDKHNKYFGPFTGGSRVLVDNALDFKRLRRGIFLALLLTIFFALCVLACSPASLGVNIGLMSVLTLLALGYTVPPLNLSYRGLGEVDVGITHSIAVVLCGYAFQGGALGHSFPWLVSIPLFLGIMPAIILAGIPDYEADKNAHKVTLAVKYGKRTALKIARNMVFASAACMILWSLFMPVASMYRYAVYIVIPHAIVLIALLEKTIRRERIPSRIDVLLFAALLYIFWFGVFPLMDLISG